MKKTLSVILAVVLVISCLAVIAACGEDKHVCQHVCPTCHKCTDATCTDEVCKEKCTCKPAMEVQTVAKTLTQNNNTDACIEGVVFVKTSEGYYLSDATGSLYVADKTAVKVGDKVKVTGKFKIDSKMPFIGNATASVTSSGNTAKTFETATLEEVAALANSQNASYCKYVSVSGIIGKDMAGIYTITDSVNTVALTEGSNTSALDEFVGRKVTIAVVTHKYVDGMWNVAFGGTASDIGKVPVNVADVKDAAFAYVTENLATEVYADLALPNSYAAEPDLTFRWTVKEGNAVQILSNIAVVELQATDTPVTLTLTLSSAIDKDNAANKASQDFTITVKQIRTLAIADLATAQIAKNEVLYITGQVIHKVRQSGLWSVILTDEAYNFLRVDLPDQNASDALALGDTIKVLGSYKATDGVYAFTTSTRENPVTVTTAAPDGFAVDYSKLPCTTLVTENDWKTVASNVSGSVVKLFKLSDPYLKLSSSSLSDSKYVRFGVSASTSHHGVAGDNGKIYNGLEKRDLTDNGLGYWLEDSFGITNTGVEGGTKYAGIEMYVFACYYVPGSTNVLQFSTSADMVTIDYDVALYDELAIAPVVMAKEAGSLNLVTTSKWAGDVTWSCEPAGIVDATTGAFAAQTQNQDIVLTASFTLNGAAKQMSFNTQLVATEVSYKTISEAVAMKDGLIAPIQGTILAFGTTNYDGLSYPRQSGVYVSDGSKIMYITAGLNYVETENIDEKLYIIGNHVLAVGDVIKLVGAKKAGMNLDISSADINVVSASDVASTDKVVWGGSYDYLVTDKASALTAMSSAKAGDVIKYVATADNPFCLATSTSWKFRMYYKDMAGSIDSIKLANRIMCTKIENTLANFGGEWWKTMYPNLVKEKISSYTSSENQFVGEFYTVYMETTNGFYVMTWLPGSFALRPISAEDLAQAAVNAELAKIQTAYTISEADTVTLPTKAGETDISWQVDTLPGDFRITANVLSYPAVTEETSIKVKAVYQIGSESKNTEITITFTPGVITYKTVTEALAVTDPTQSINVAGNVIAYSSASGNGKAAQGFYIADGSNIMLVKAGGNIVAKTEGATHFTFTIGSDEIAIGTYVQIAGVTVDGKAATCASSAAASIDETKFSTTFSFAPTADVTISDNTSLANYASTFTIGSAADYKIIKLVGTKDNPLYLTCPYFYTLAFTYDHGTSGWSKLTTAGAKYDVAGGAQAAFCFGVPAIAATMGAEWTINNTPVNWATPGDCGARTTYGGAGGYVGCFKYVGECYCIYSGLNDSSNFVYYDILPVGCTLQLTALTEVIEAMPTTVDASAAGTFTVPTTISAENRTNWITTRANVNWSTTSAGVTISEGVVSFDAVTQDTVIELTVELVGYSNGDPANSKNATFNYTFTITLKAAE